VRLLQFVAAGDPGGGTTHVLQLLRGLCSRYDLALLTQRNTYLAETARQLGCLVYEGDFFRSRLDPRAAMHVARTLADFQPDVLHCHGGRAAFYPTWMKDSTPKVYTVHGFHYPRKGFVARQFGRLAEIRSLRRADCVIFVSHYDHRLAIEDGLLPSNKRHRVIHNGIAPPQARDVELTGEIGFIGRLVPQKHPELFLDAVKLLPNRRAVIAGGGPLESAIRREIKQSGLADRVRCTGSLTHDESLRLMASLDVLVMTSRWEGLPLLPMEAMWLGIPIVATAVGGLPELIADRRTGMLSEAESPEALAEAILQLDGTPELRELIVRAGRECVQSQFSEQAMIKATEEVYQALSPAAATVELLEAAG
jgi:glycosyltransferase involved in cell wall biosynthesis